MNHQTFVSATTAVAVALSTAVSAVAAPGVPTLTKLGTYSTGEYQKSAAEIVAHDPATQRLYVVNALQTTVDVLDISDPTNPAKIGAIDLVPYGGVANSVAVKDGVLAVAVESFKKTDPGAVVLFDRDLSAVSSVQVGSLPDMLTFSPDGRWLLVANEGEPNGYDGEGEPESVDPEGSVSIIDLSKRASRVTQADVRTASFTAFNHAPLDPRIRIYGPNATVAQDLEPEYIAVSHDSKTAWVTLQENNAIARIDIRSAKVTSLVGLGLKDHSLARNGFDASDRDDAAGTGPAINIRPWRTKGMYQPDSIAAYKVGSATYLITANEGDARDWPGFGEEIRIAHADYRLDPDRFPDAATLKENRNLGRLRATAASGDLDGDGDYDEIWTFGARSFSIWTAEGALVADSGKELEEITASAYPTRFNASHDNNALDARSPSKGPEPEGLAVGKAYSRTWAFIGLERIGGLAIYDVSNPARPAFSSYVNNRDLEVTPSPQTLDAAGDLGPEGVLFIPEENSPTGRPLVVVGNEISGTTTIYEFALGK